MKVPKVSVHPRTGSPFYRYEVQAPIATKYLSGRIPCGIVRPGETEHSCANTPDAMFLLRFACGGYIETPICTYHLDDIREHLSAVEVVVIEPGLN